MRISDWSSDVCSSVLTNRIYLLGNRLNNSTLPIHSFGEGYLGWVAGFLNDSFSHIQLRPVRFGWQGDYLGSFGQPIGNMACKPVVLNRVMHRQMTHWGLLGSVDGKIIPDSENRFLREAFTLPDILASLGEIGRAACRE